MEIRRRIWVWLTAILAVLALAGCRPVEQGTAPPTPDNGTPDAVDSPEPGEEVPDLPAFSRLEGITTVSDYDGSGQSLSRWQERVPGIQDIRIPSTIDEAEQRALWLAPGELQPAPLLVVVHSWSAGYLQNANIPFGVWAQRSGWAMIAPDFRGVNDRPEATGSDLAVQDVIDAVDYAIDQGGVDHNRVFIVGYSGGGMASLLLAGRHPDRFAGAVSFVPVYDLIDWYDYVRTNLPGRAYTRQITASCGGDPSVPGDAQQSCRHRSPEAHLSGAGDAGMPVYIAHGLDDQVVPPSYAARAFNQLAQPGDRLDDETVRGLRQNRLPGNLRGSVTGETFFGDEDPEVFFARSSGPVTLVLFDGGHDMVYNPGLAFLHRVASER